jgi:hypothetical protein
VAAAVVALVNSEHVLGNALLKGPDTPRPPISVLLLKQSNHPFPLSCLTFLNFQI